MTVDQPKLIHLIFVVEVMDALQYNTFGTIQSILHALRVFGVSKPNCQQPHDAVVADNACCRRSVVVGTE